ncbi:MAG: divergent polysaccharide deacetylase family protein [Clostridia bacterium]|nr:divergent polysaccharide deacetylase family protein [Clostridia bacterium]
MKISKIVTSAEIILLIIFFLLIARLIQPKLKSVSAVEKPKVALVIDDFGNGSKGTEEMLKLPVKFTAAVMPYMPKSVEEMDRLAAMNKEVILHQPMEAHTGQRSWLGATPILENMSIDEVRQTFIKNADQLNKAVGFNNHMGSLITEDREKMTEILKIAKDRGWFYIDSVTSARSVAGDLAKELGVPSAKRDVFLDSTQDKNKIKENLRKTINIAKEKGKALAIGHVGAEGGVVTAEAISEILNEAGDEVDFVYASEIVE